MSISKKLEGTKMEVVLEGRLDTETAPELETVLADGLGEVTELTLDLGGVNYISSAGLRVLLSTQKIMSKQGSMIVTNVSEDIMEFFELTGFSEILTIA